MIIKQKDSGLTQNLALVLERMPLIYDNTCIECRHMK